MAEISKVGAMCDSKDPLNFMQSIRYEVMIPLLAILGGIGGYAVSRKL